MVVISYGIPVTEGIPEHLRAQVEEAWHKMQADLAGISSKGSLQRADRSGHNIPVEQPDIIIQAIRDVLADDRGRGGAADLPGITLP